MTSGVKTISWNSNVVCILSDIDDTLAETYSPLEPAITAELDRLIADGHALFLVTGGGLSRVLTGITGPLRPESRRRVLISHCSGAEVWGFDEQGELRAKPFYSLYDEVMTPEQQTRWRDVTAQLLKEFELRPHAVRPKPQFWQEVGQDPRDVMYDDRGPQITIEVVNAVNLSEEQLASFDHQIALTHGQRDLRVAMLERAEQLFAAADVPVTPRLGGMFALDLALQGVSKTTSIQRVLSDEAILSTVGLKKADTALSNNIEIWGDKFSAVRGGTDRHMSEAVDPAVRSIDFRDEDVSEFLPGYNTVLWDGQHRLHHGLLEYLQRRNS